MFWREGDRVLGAWVCIIWVMLIWGEERFIEVMLRVLLRKAIVRVDVKKEWVVFIESVLMEGLFFIYF